MWIASWDNVDQIERRPHFWQQALLTVFVDETRAQKIAILPESHTLCTFIFCEVADHVHLL
jgi:hypothetical protein